MVPSGDNLKALLQQMRPHAGPDLWVLSQRQPVLLVFLRQLGCIFCKEAMSDIAERRERLEACGVQVVCVHMGEEEEAERVFREFGLADVPRIADPDAFFYRRFGLLRGSFTQLFGLQTWIRGYQIYKEKGFRTEYSKRLGDSFQMPGVFVLHEGQVKEQFIHRMASDRPDYDELIRCCVPQ
ncbi:MAG: AhpC/TSA family protein [Bacteroidetes bacterium]|nr:MAG: AhpC/TSA family protein [Bacteroidota bacterium]